MGRDKRDLYYKGLHCQAHEKLTSMLAFGDSRADDKRTGADRQKIYSFATYRTYRRAIMRFVKYVEQYHPNCTSLKKARKYANEWLESRVEAGMSAWTVSMEASAISKLYNIPADSSERFHSPQRRREDIKRSRGDAKRDKHFSVRNNDELIKFVCATGTRRGVLQKLRGGDLWSKERAEQKLAELREKEKLTDAEARQLRILQEALSTFPEFSFYLAHNQDKGGRYRIAPILFENQDLVVRRMQAVAPDELVFQHIHAAADIHHYRGIYAKTLYRKLARSPEDIPYDKIHRGTGKLYQSDLYICRADEKGRFLDRRALLLTSIAMGHSRVDVIVRNYLYGL